MSRFNVIHWDGQMLVYAPEGDTWSAHFLGDSRAVPMTDSLRSAIEADTRHQAEKKLQEPGKSVGGAGRI